MAKLQKLPKLIYIHPMKKKIIVLLSMNNFYKRQVIPFPGVNEAVFEK